MNKQVSDYLDNKRSEIEKAHRKEKEELLMSLNMYEKVYSPTDTRSDEYNCSDYSAIEGKVKYFKRIPIQITDEEFEEIKKLNAMTDTQSINTPTVSKPKVMIENTTDESNKIATLLYVIAWIIFIGGFIIGIKFANVEVVKGNYYHYADTEFSLTLAIMYWGISFISGLVFIGFSEVIRLLTGIRNKQYHIHID